MITLPTEWRPVPVAALQSELAGFPDWGLCGGYAVARIIGEDTRPHGDIDVGVFRSQLTNCLRVLGTERVFLCRRGRHLAWDGAEVPAEGHDIWITDRTGRIWVLRVKLFDDEGDRVIHRRDRRITWAKQQHSLEIGGMRVLNPMITVLFKTNKPHLEDKEVQHVRQLIRHSGWMKVGSSLLVADATQQNYNAAVQYPMFRQADAKGLRAVTPA